MFQAFWAWYERHYVLNVSVALGFFLLQIAHLTWLGGDVIATRLTGSALFDFRGFWEIFIIVVDYTEIPALITMSLVYIHAWKKERWYAILMLTFLNTQWLHLFWITDEYVVDTFTGSHTHETFLPHWLAWVAIAIDYLEVPVILDTTYKLFTATRDRRGLTGMRQAFDESGV